MTARTKAVSEVNTPRQRLGLYLILVGALAAFCVTTYRYTMPLSGITNAGGALLTAASEFILIVAALLLTSPRRPRAIRGFLLFLCWVIVILAFIAELFLHGWISSAFLVIAAIGVILRTFSGSSGRSV